MTAVLERTESVARADFGRAKSEALGLLRRFKITEPPVNPVEVARDLGVNVYFVEFEQNFQNISGFYDSENGSIYVNTSESPVRQTFTIAHELGHKILHEEWAKSSDYKILMRDQAAESKDIHEQEANTFAANLLVPRFMLDRYWQIASVADLSKLFAVSVPVIKNRIKFEYGA